MQLDEVSKSFRQINCVIIEHTHVHKVFPELFLGAGLQLIPEVDDHRIHDVCSCTHLRQDSHVHTGQLKQTSELDYRLMFAFPLINGIRLMCETGKSLRFGSALSPVPFTLGPNVQLEKENVKMTVCDLKRKCVF